MKKWIVQDVYGNIQGPFDEEEICQKIQSLEFYGEEKISAHLSLPQVWVPITRVSRFQKLLSENKTKNKTKSFEEVRLKTHSETLKPNHRTKKINSEKTNPNLSSSSQRSQTQKSYLRNLKSIRISRKDKDSVIEMKDSKFIWVSYILKVFVIPLLLLGGAFYLFDLYFNSSSKKLQSSSEKVQLIFPQNFQSSQGSSEMEIEKGLASYFQGQPSEYLKAQQYFVQAIEGNPRHKLAHAYLCLTYLELWPFTDQRSDDLQVVSKMLERVKSIKASEVHSSVCRSVYLILQEQYNLAEDLVRNSIDLFAQNSETEILSPFLYYLRGMIRFRKLNLDRSLQDLDNAQTLLPKMYGATLLKAQVYEQKQQFSVALKTYSKISQDQPNHKTALLAQGILRYNYLRQFSSAEKLIRQALEIPGLVSPQYLSSAYFILTQEAFKIKNSKEFFEYGKKAYALNPNNETLKELLQKEGFDESQQWVDTGLQSRLLIEKGDQFEREGNLIEAQRYYRDAFLADDKRNVVAAVKMGRVLWEAGFSLEAIDWMQKAIYADSQYIRSYILISDYYSRIYKMKQAAHALKTAQKKSPNNIEVFKGYARLSIREGAFSLAIQFAQKAIQIYEFDVESYLILSQAYYLLGDFVKSFDTISKARELAVHNREVHIQYGKALGKIQGLDASFSYFEELISKVQTGSQNHTQYVLALSEYLLDYEEFQNALNILEVLSDLKKKPIRYHLLLGKIYAKMKGGTRQAYEEFLKATSINPTDPQVMFQMALVLVKLKDYDRAESYLNRLANAYENYPQVHYQIAQILFLKGGDENLRKALEKLEFEIKVNPRFLNSYKLIGSIYKALKEYRLCATAYQRAIGVSKRDMESYIEGASCYQKSGDMDLALQILKGAMEVQEDLLDPIVYRELGYLYELKKDYVQATKNYGIYIRNFPQAEDLKKIQSRIDNFPK